MVLGNYHNIYHLLLAFTFLIKININKSFKINPEIIKTVEIIPGECDFKTSPVKKSASPRNKYINSFPAIYSPLFALAII